MDTDQLAIALRVSAAGYYPLEAGTELLIGNGTFLDRDDFTTRFVHHGTSEATPMAAIDWDASITALASGGLPLLRRRTTNHWTEQKAPQVKLSDAAPLPHARFRSSLAREEQPDPKAASSSWPPYP